MRWLTMGFNVYKPREQNNLSRMIFPSYTAMLNSIWCLIFSWIWPNVVHFDPLFMANWSIWAFMLCRIFVAFQLVNVEPVDLTSFRPICCGSTCSGPFGFNKFPASFFSFPPLPPENRVYYNVWFCLDEMNMTIYELLSFYHVYFHNG